MSNDKKKHVHVTANSGNNEWYTPKEYIEAARLVMGGIDLDPATSEFANQTVCASNIFTAEDDALEQEWPIGRIWMNPPYAQPLMTKFAERIVLEVSRGSEAIVLVNNATETKWFQHMLSSCSAVCLHRRRIRFLDRTGNPKQTPVQGQSILYFGENKSGFRQVFSEFGIILFT